MCRKRPHSLTRVPLQELSLEGCVHLSGADTTEFAGSIPQLLLLDLTSIKVHDQDLARLQTLTSLRALRMRPQVSPTYISRMARDCMAPVWKSLNSCHPKHRWVASRGSAGWQAFLSKCWKIPELSL